MKEKLESTAGLVEIAPHVTGHRAACLVDDTPHVFIGRRIASGDFHLIACVPYDPKDPDSKLEAQISAAHIVKCCNGYPKAIEGANGR